MADNAKGTFEERLAILENLLKKFQSTFIEKETVATHIPSDIRTKLLPKVHCVYDALTAFLNRCTDDSVECGKIDVYLRGIIDSNIHDSSDTQELEQSITTLLQELSPHMLPWHIHLHPLMTDIISKRFRDYPFSIDYSHRVDGELP